MAVHALSAARSLCELRDWTISNLALQKILYIAHMFHLGRTGAPLISEQFEAWDYGPVVPEVYRRVRGFGSERIRNVFHWVPGVPEGSSEMQLIHEAADATKGMTPGRLVSITHSENGAWYKCYKPGYRGIVRTRRPHG